MARRSIKRESPKKECPICKKEKAIASGYYKTASPLFSIDRCVPICITCVKNGCLNDDGTVNEQLLKVMCQRIDKPFYKDDLDSAFLQAKREFGYLSDDEVAKKGEKIIGYYFKNINSLRQNLTKSFSDSEKDGFTHKKINYELLHKREEEQKRRESVLGTSSESTVGCDADDSSKVQKEKEVKWTKKDKQNMKYVLSSIGYDPYDDVGLSESDRKYCYNMLAGYLDTDGVMEDGHKMQAVIEITMLYSQCRKITDAMNEELKKTHVSEKKVQSLTSSKSSLLSSISTIAKDNSIASNYNKNSKQGQNSLTSKMKEMEDNGFQEIAVNLFDIKTAEAFKQISFSLLAEA